MVRGSSGRQSESHAPELGKELDKVADDVILKVLIAPEELTAQKKKKLEEKFEELSDQFRQKGITPEMRSCIDNFSKD